MMKPNKKIVYIQYSILGSVFKNIELALPNITESKCARKLRDFAPQVKDLLDNFL